MKVLWLSVHICDHLHAAKANQAKPWTLNAFLKKITSRLNLESPTPLLLQSVNVCLCGQNSSIVQIQRFLQSLLVHSFVSLFWLFWVFLYVYFFYCEYQEITFIFCQCRGLGLLWLIRTLPFGLLKSFKEEKPPSLLCKGKKLDRDNPVCHKNY